MLYNKPKLSSVFYTSKNPYYNSGFGLPNCTCYALGRVYETSGLCPSWRGNPYINSSKNISIWNLKDDFKKSQSPKVGSVAIFESGNTGHIAFIEEIKANGNILISESSFGDYNYKKRTLSKSNNYKHPYGKLVGFKETTSTIYKKKGGDVLEGWHEYEFGYWHKNRKPRTYNKKEYTSSFQPKVNLNYYKHINDVGTGKNTHGHYKKGQLLNNTRFVKYVNGYCVHGVLNDAGTGEVYIAIHG